MKIYVQANLKWIRKLWSFSGQGAELGKTMSEVIYGEEDYFKIDPIPSEELELGKNAKMLNICNPLVGQNSH